MFPTNPSKFVGPEGPLDAKIVLVGEAPGATEVAMRRPFCGSAGKLLNDLLHRAGIQRNSCYVTNVVKEQPFKNDISQFITFRNGSSKPTVKYAEYEKALYDELLALNPNVIVALGQVSCYALTRKIGVTKWRGSMLPGPGGCKVIPTIHPAAALRQYNFIHIIAQDLQRVYHQAQFPELRLPQRRMILAPTFAQCMEFLAMLKSAQLPVATDIEVVNLEVSCISFCNDPYNVICIPFVDEHGDYFTPEQEHEIWLAITDLLQDPHILKIGQNIIFDSNFLFRRYGINVTPKADTMIGQYLIAPELPKGLDFITSIYTEEPYYKDDGKKWFRGVSTNYNTFWSYNAKDSAVCHEAFPAIMQDVRRLGNEHAYRNKIRLIEPLLYMQEHGILVDVEGMRRASDEAGVEIQRLTGALQERVGYAVNPNSQKQLCDLFYNKLKFKPYTNRKTGGVTTDEKALKRLAGKGCVEAQLVLQIRKLSKLKSTYYDVRVDPDHRLRCAFNPVGTKGERISSSESIFETGGNFQNIPTGVRRYLLADIGMELYNIDLSQAENRMVAYIAPDLTMIHAFETGIDIHRRTASLIFSKPMEEISSDEDCEKDPSRYSSIGGGVYSERFWGKKANHGLNYGLGYKYFAMLYEISEADAKFIVDRYHAAYPGVRQYHAWVRDKLGKDRMLEDCYGRKRLFLDRWGDDLFNEAYSFIPQSSVATKINLDGLLFVYENQTRFAEVELLNQVHDSISFQIPTSLLSTRKAEILCAIRDSLESPISWRGTAFVIPADCKTGRNLRDMKKVDWHKYRTIEELAAHLESLAEVAPTPEPEEDETEEILEGVTVDGDSTLE